MAEGMHRPSRRPTGYGKIVDSPPKSMEETLKPKPDRQARANRSTPVNPDAPYRAKVVGSMAKPVRLR